MIKKCIESLLDNYAVKYSKSIRGYVSTRTNKFLSYNVEMIPENWILIEMLGEYKYYDIQKDDIVLDIGSFVGGFSMFIHKSVKQVYAVEPLFTDILRKNINQNNINNVEIIEAGIGTGTIDCSFHKREKKNVKCFTLTELKEKCGGHVDFLKIDCEGGEWSIKPHELEGIRRIEAEVHCFNGERLLDFSDMLKDVGYEVMIEDEGSHISAVMI